MKHAPIVMRGIIEPTRPPTAIEMNAIAGLAEDWWHRLRLRLAEEAAGKREEVGSRGGTPLQELPV